MSIALYLHATIAAMMRRELMVYNDYASFIAYKQMRGGRRMRSKKRMDRLANKKSYHRT